MIEQVLYRRDQGYVEYRSRGLTKEEAHRVNVFLGNVASGINDLGSGADAPFVLYPFDTIHKVCLATFQREFSNGRSNSVNHGLLIEKAEYNELAKSPEQIWGFTNKNFQTRTVNHREELFSLESIEVSDDPALNKDHIFEEYALSNKGYLKLLSIVQTSLSFDKSYTCGIRIDSSRDANKVMRHLGYVIMCMLPYELRDKISFCSRSVPDNIKVTVQILQEKDADKTDITYNLDTQDCTLNNSSVEITDFYLGDLLEMSDSALKLYFGALDLFKNELEIIEDSKAQYVVSKLLKLQTNPEIFSTETVEDQFTFINDVLALPTKNKATVNAIVVSLLPYVDPKHYMEVFSINFGLYQKLDPNKISDRNTMSKIEDNLVQNYSNATAEEKAELFKDVLLKEQDHSRILDLLKRFVDVNDLKTDRLLADTYLSLFEEFFNDDWKTVLYQKAASVFGTSDITEKRMIWKQMYTSTVPEAKDYFLFNILCDEDEPFQKAVFHDLVALYSAEQDPEAKERYYSRIQDVIQKEDDRYLLQILCKYNNAAEIEDSLWLYAFNSIDDHQSLYADNEYRKCLEEKYYHSSNPDIRDLYLQYLRSASISDLESIIQKYGKKTGTGKLDDQLLNKIVYYLARDNKKLSIAALKILASVIKDDGANDLASYISKAYLSKPDETTNEIYEYLETEQPSLYGNSFLNKESLSSFDKYCASKLNRKVLDNDQDLVSVVLYLDQLLHHNESFTKLNDICQKYIDQELSAAKSDYECFKKYQALTDKFGKIASTQFGKQYYSGLVSRARKSFWKNSNINRFEYKNCEIYRSGSEVYSQEFELHENHMLAEDLDGLISNSVVDWDKVYSILLTKRIIKQDNIRNQIVDDFLKQYRENNLPVSSPDYIAFINVNKSSLKMDYNSLFDDLQRFNYPIDDRNINRLQVFNYVKTSEQLKKKISEYKNYMSDNPSYGEVIRTMIFEQFAVVVLLFVNSISRSFALRMTDNMKARNTLLLCNYTGYILIMIGVAVISILLMRRANLRRSPLYDKYAFGLLIVNMICSAAAILLNAKFTNILLCILATVFFMAIAIVLTIKSTDVIGKSHREAMR